MGGMLNGGIVKLAERRESLVPLGAGAMKAGSCLTNIDHQSSALVVITHINYTGMAARTWCLLSCYVAPGSKDK